MLRKTECVSECVCVRARARVLRSLTLFSSTLWGQEKIVMFIHSICYNRAQPGDNSQL